MSRRFPTARATEHVLALAEEHGVHITWIRGFYGARSYPPGFAELPRPTSGLRYLIALHELGHCADEFARSWTDETDPYGESVCEGFAWAWATRERDRSIPVTRHEWTRAGDLMASYWAQAQPQEPGGTDPVSSP